MLGFEPETQVHLFLRNKENKLQVCWQGGHQEPKSTKSSRGESIFFFFCYFLLTYLLLLKKSVVLIRIRIVWRRPAWSGSAWRMRIWFQEAKIRKNLPKHNGFSTPWIRIWILLEAEPHSGSGSATLTYCWLLWLMIHIWYAGSLSQAGR